MKFVLLVIVLFFACYGLLNIVINIFSPPKKCINQYMVVRADGNAEKIEYDVRTLMQKYTDCEIVIINENEDGEVDEILNNLCNDYCRIHMLRKNELPDLF